MEKRWGLLNPQSGFGKQFIRLQTQFQTEPIKIEVEISSTDGSYTARGVATIAPLSPKVLVYENRPLAGVRFDKALKGEHRLDGNEILLFGIPYFFSAIQRTASNLTFNWEMNDTFIPPSEQDRSILILRNESGSSGISSINLIVENSNGILQSAENKFSLLYGNE